MLRSFLLFVALIQCSSFLMRKCSSKLRTGEIACSKKKELWDESVEYVDLSANVEESATARSLPLFLLTGAFYPSGITYLNIFEMKYRTMMFDCANSDDMFGYIHFDSRTGMIAKYGTMVKVFKRELLEDGRQYIAIEGVGRFRVRKILKTLPYVLGEVEPNIIDDIPESQLEAAKLEQEVYNSLKYYMRLMKTFAPNQELVVSPKLKETRPYVGNYNQEPNARRTAFSFALANMIQMQRAQESQVVLQTTDIIKRLTAENKILVQAAELVSSELIKRNLLTADLRDSLKMQAINSEYDEDILPVDKVATEVVKEKDEWDISNIE